METSTKNPTVRPVVPQVMSLSDSILSFYMHANNPELKGKFEKIPPFLPELELRGYEALVPEGKTPVWHYWREFVFDYLHERKSTNTIIAVLNSLRFIVRHGGLYTIEDINQPRTLKFILQEQGFKRNWTGSGSFNTYRKNIGIYFKWLEDLEVIEKNKVYNVRKIKEAKKFRPHFEEDQIKQIRKHLKARDGEEHEVWRNQLFFELAINTSARVGELLGIKLEDITVKNGVYSIRIYGSKQNNDIRPFYLPATSRDMFEHYLTVRKKLGREDDPYLFLSRRSGKNWTYNAGVARLCKQLSEELGFKVSMHKFRRSGATILDQHEIPLGKNMQHLGHTKTTTTASYIQPNPEHTKRSVALLDSIR